MAHTNVSPDDVFQLYSSSPLRASADFEWRKKCLWVGLVIYMFYHPIPFTSLPFGTHAIALLHISLHMNMTQQETIKISNNLMAAMLVPVSGNDDEDALSFFRASRYKTTSVPNISCTFLYVCALNRKRAFLYRGIVCDWQFLLNCLIRD